jgi:hypothetical protein
MRHTEDKTRRPQPISNKQQSNRSCTLVGVAFGAAGQRKVENGFGSNNHSLENEISHIHSSEAVTSSITQKISLDSIDGHDRESPTSSATEMSVMCAVFTLNGARSTKVSV